VLFGGSLLALLLILGAANTRLLFLQSNSSIQKTASEDPLLELQTWSANE